MIFNGSDERTAFFLLDDLLFPEEFAGVAGADDEADLTLAADSSKLSFSRNLLKSASVSCEALALLSFTTTLN